MTITLTTFIPGTKAKADEVNANFTALKNAVDEKAAIDGDNTQIFSVADATNDEHAVNKGQLDDLSDDLTVEIKKAGTKFCVKSGNTSNGAGHLFSYSVLEVTPLIAGTYDDLVVSDYRGVQTTISTTPDSIDLTGNSDGNYNIFINTSGELYILNNTIYKQPNRPTMVVNDVWLNTSVEPFECIKYSGTTDVEFLDVPLGKVTIESSAITAIETFAFNQDGHNITAQTTLESGTNLALSFSNLCIPDYENGVSKTWATQYTAESNGFLMCYAPSNSTNSYVTINGTQMQIIGGSGAASGSLVTLPVAKGDIYTFTGSTSGTIKFFPMRAV
ncbi:MAG: hypothetical protein PHC64_00510 [Candidatus Gastranaerophilales bacterium]|nr:hypothetical protein [Candidatus Gastranaerophilales bacterium]